MTLILALLLLLAAIWCMANLKAPYPAVPSVTLLLLLALSFLTGISLLWLLIALIAVLLLLFLSQDELRKRYVSAPLLRQFRRVLPEMSQSEREALDAGTVGWDRELFCGHPRWQKLLDTRYTGLSEQEQAFLDGPVQQLCERLDDWQITHQDRDLPPEIWQFIKDQGFFGMIVAKEYGGLEFSARAHSEVVMKLASRSITAAVTVMVPNSLGPAKLLQHYGTAEQKEHYLPRLARGEEIPCFALTGPQAGSDAAALPDTGVVCFGEHRGRKVLGIRLQFEKRYITLGPIATVIGLAFQLSDPEQLLDENDATGITLALIPSDTPGIERGERHIPLDIPFQNGPLHGKDVFIPIDWVIGGRAGLGRGWPMLMESLAEGRGISLPALATGAGKMGCRYTGAYAALRRQFNQAIGHFEGVEEALARMAGLTYQMDAARINTLASIDAGERPAVISAVIKYHLTERYRQVINDAMDIQGGSGICLGRANLLGRAYQAIPISITVEGANILTRSLIIFGQGAIRCHPFLLREFEAAHGNSSTSLDDFDQALFGHIGFILANAARSFFNGLTRGAFSDAPSDNRLLKRYFRYLNWMSAAFALCSDFALMTLGGSLKRRERLSARLGDLLSELYITSAVLKRHHDAGCPEEDEPLIRWCCEQSLYHMQEAIRAICRNLPHPPLGWLLRMLIFPTGTPFTPPDDHTDHQVARLLLHPSDSRDRLTQGVFLCEDLDEKVGLLEAAFSLSHSCQDIAGTLRGALREGLVQGEDLAEILESAQQQGLLDAEQAGQLDRLEKLRNRVIQVDAHASY